MAKYLCENKICSCDYCDHIKPHTKQAICDRDCFGNYTCQPIKERKMKKLKKGEKLIGTDPKGRKIYMGSTKKVEQYAPFIKYILGVVGHPEALVTDESSLGDFCPDKRKLKSWCTLLKNQAIYLVEGHTYLWEIAQALEGQAGMWLQSAPNWVLEMNLKIHCGIKNKRRTITIGPTIAPVSRVRANR